MAMVIALSAGVKPALVAAQLRHRLDVLLNKYGRYLPRKDDYVELLKLILLLSQILTAFLLLTLKRFPRAIRIRPQCICTLSGNFVMTSAPFKKL
jgi:hypothetical protein